jgi:hypothetical protein
MAFIKPYATNTGLEAPNAYHVIVKVDNWKRVVDDPDPDKIRPKDSPEYNWKAGYWGRICIGIYASKEARDTGKPPIAVTAVYPTDIPFGYMGEVKTDLKLQFAIDLNSPKNEVEQAYDFLATLPYYQDATKG